MDRNRAEFWVFPKVSSVASVLQAGRSLLKLLAKALSIWKNIHLLATAVSDCFDTFLLKLGSEHLKDWQPWIENAEYKLVKIFIFHVAFAERTFTDTVMANQDGIGNQLLHQRPDLVRRAWVPVLVGIFSTFLWSSFVELIYPDWTSFQPSQGYQVRWSKTLQVFTALISEEPFC